MFRATRLRRGLKRGKYNANFDVRLLIEDVAKMEKHLAVGSLLLIFGITATVVSLLLFDLKAIDPPFIGFLGGAFVAAGISQLLGASRERASNRSYWLRLIRVSRLAVFESIEFFLSVDYREQVKEVHAGLSSLANRLVKVEEDYPGDDDDPEHVITKREFNLAFEDVESLGYLNDGDRKSDFFSKR